MKRNTKKSIAVCLLFLILECVGTAWAAFSSFVVKDIQFRGLQRIERSTVETYLPIKVGQRVTPQNTSNILKKLYQTEFFSDIRLMRGSNNTLVIVVVERPIIADIKIKGNHAIPKKPFDEMIVATGLAKGHIFNREVLEQVKLVLLNQYKEQSLYNAKVHINVQPLPSNRVLIKVHIREGKPSRIEKIDLYGNSAFTDAKLIKHMELSTTHFWSWFTKGDYYAHSKLEKGLQSLRYYYLDRGYLEFSVQSHQVLFKQQKRKVYITIHVNEGPVYRLGTIRLSGDLKGYEHALRKQLTIKPGDLFSRRELIKDQKNMVHYLAEKGYAFAEVHIKPQTDTRTQRIAMTLEVVPGRYVYVRQINFHGNKKTNDVVLRREIRQMESSLLSLSKIKESKRRLANLGYLEDIEMKIKPVPSQMDQVDVEYVVKEKSSAKATFQLGLSDTEGLLYGASLSQSNFMGMGKAVDLSFDRSAYRRTFSFYFNNPYYTITGHSLGFNIFAERTTPGRTNIAAYKTNAYGAAVHYGIPLSDYSRLSLALGYEHIELNAGFNSSKEVASFIADNGGIIGSKAAKFNQFKWVNTLTYSSYDRSIFPTEGHKSVLIGEVGLPIGGRSLDYYLLTYHGAWYQPLPYHFILSSHLNLGYGRGYARTGNDLPFFKNYYAGGIGSIRGYEGNTLGPKDSNGHALGGNVLTTGSIGIILPPYFGSSVRTSLFLDAGSVAKNELGDLRYSAGIMIEWHTPMAPLEFSLAKPLNKRRGDKRNFFQFSLGSSF